MILACGVGVQLEMPRWPAACPSGPSAPGPTSSRVPSSSAWRPAALSTLGFAVIQSRLQAVLRKTDTCGVLYLHGLPGLLGGLAALLLIATPGIQAAGIALTVAFAVASGFVAGKILSAFGRRRAPYMDDEELIVETEE